MVKKNSKFQVVFVVGIFLLGGSLLSATDALRTKEFVVMGYQGLLFELQSTEGPYVRTLLELLGVNSDDKEKTVRQIRSLSKSTPNIMDFADQVVKLQAMIDVQRPLTETTVLIPAGPNVTSGDKVDNVLSHLTRGKKITVFTKGGARFEGNFEEYSHRRLWIKSTGRRSFSLADILAVETPDF